MAESLKRFVLIVSSVILFLPVVGYSQSRPVGKVDGSVRIIGGDTEIVSVQLQHLGLTVQEQFSADGRFTFWNVPNGPYTLSIRIPGHEPISQEVSVPGELILIEIGSRTKLPAKATTSVFELQIPRSARRQYEHGQDRLREGDCAAALKYLGEAIRQFPGYADAHNAIGTCRVRLDQPALAEKAFKTAIELTTSVYPAINLSDTYIKQGRLEEADAVLTRALRRNPTHGDAYYGLALLRVEQHRVDEAEQLASQAHNYSQHIADVHLLLAQIHQRLGSMDLIRADLQSYVKEAKPSPARDRIQKILTDSHIK